MPIEVISHSHNIIIEQYDGLLEIEELDRIYNTVIVPKCDELAPDTLYIIHDVTNIGMGAMVTATHAKHKNVICANFKRLRFNSTLTKIANTKLNSKFAIWSCPRVLIKGKITINAIRPLIIVSRDKLRYKATSVFS